MAQSRPGQQNKKAGSALDHIRTRIASKTPPFSAMPSVLDPTSLPRTSKAGIMITHTRQRRHESEWEVHASIALALDNEWLSGVHSSELGGQLQCEEWSGPSDE